MIRTSLQTGEWVTSKTSRTLTSIYPYKTNQEIFTRFHVQSKTYQFKALPFGLSTAPLEFTVVTKEVKLVALQTGIRIRQYLVLVGPGQIPPNLSPAYTNISSSVSGPRLTSKHGKIRTGPQASLRRLPGRPEIGWGVGVGGGGGEGGKGQTHPGPVADTDN